MSSKPTTKAAASNPPPTRGQTNEISTGRWLLGMAMATTFACVYFFAPMYMITAILALIFRYPNMEWSFVIAAPLVLSILSKPKKIDCRFLKPMADYFDYETAFEVSDGELRKLVNESNKKFILASQPHGVVSTMHAPVLLAKANLYFSHILSFCLFGFFFSFRTVA